MPLPPPAACEATAKSPGELERRRRRREEGELYLTPRLVLPSYQSPERRQVYPQTARPKI
eukprot:765014-Hanusia_phi.AAC.3